MARRAWLAVLLAVGCGGASDDGPVVTDHFAMGSMDRAEASAATACADGAYAAAPGTEARFAVRALRRDVSCHCAETTTYAWSCSSERHCMSDYDYGGHNPTVCEPVAEDDADVTSASVDLLPRDYPVVPGCTVSFAPLPGTPRTYEVSVSCPKPARLDVMVKLGTDAGAAQAGASLHVTADGACPAPKSPGAG